MGDISPHFSRKEFACGCGFTAVDVELLDVLEDARTHFGAAITIDCACRCPKHNKDVGGVENSQHVQGIAADIKVAGFSRRLSLIISKVSIRSWSDDGLSALISTR